MVHHLPRSFEHLKGDLFSGHLLSTEEEGTEAVCLYRRQERWTPPDREVASHQTRSRDLTIGKDALVVGALSQVSDLADMTHCHAACPKYEMKASRNIGAQIVIKEKARRPAGEGVVQTRRLPWFPRD